MSQGASSVMSSIIWLGIADMIGETLGEVISMSVCVPWSTEFDCDKSTEEKLEEILLIESRLPLKSASLTVLSKKTCAYI